jgi:hypothetical protein
LLDTRLDITFTYQGIAMDIDDIREIIKQPESDVLEFKTHPPSPPFMARLISAFEIQKVAH